MNRLPHHRSSWGFCLLFAVVVTLSGYGATYYVAPAGDDSWAGTEVAPWRTIQHALSEAAAGDIILVREGTYAEHIESVRAGTGGAPIVVSSAPGETARIDGTASAWSTGVVIIHDYIHLVGLEVTNWSSTGIWVQGAGYTEIQDCVVHEASYGIGLGAGAHDFLLERVEIYRFDLYGFDASPSGGPDCHDGTLRDCVAHTGRTPGQNVDGFALGHGNQSGFEFIRCETYAVYDGFDISADNTTLSQCSAHNNGNAGFKSWADGVALVNCIAYGNDVCNLELDWDGDPGTTTVWNCTFFDAPVFNVWVENAGDTLGLYNSILAGGDNIGLAFEQYATPSYVGNHNVFHNRNASRAIAVGYTDEFSLADIESGTWTTYSGQDGSSLVASLEALLFADPSAPDLHLAVGSPALDAGTDVGAPAIDFDGTPRPQGSAHDCGAYEQVIDTSAIFRTRATGDLLMDGVLHSAAFATGFADVAEWVASSEPAEPGDLLELDPENPGQCRRTREALSPLVAGIVSSKPGVALGAEAITEGKALLALVGIVPLKVTDEGGTIQPGDLLVSSSTPGHAMRWSGPEPCPCALVGKALEPMTDESGIILVLLTAH